MAYTKKLDPAKYRDLEPYLERILSLEKGHWLTISGYSREDAVYVRWLLYNWLHHIGMKGYFRLRTEHVGNEAYVIRVRRTGIAAEPIVTEEAIDPEAKEVDELVRLMLLADDAADFLLRIADEAKRELVRRRYEAIMA